MLNVPVVRHEDLETVDHHDDEEEEDTAEPSGVGQEIGAVWKLVDALRESDVPEPQGR